MQVRPFVSFILVVISITAALIFPKNINAVKPAQNTIRTIQSASELDYPPFSVIRDDGSADGFSVELLTAVTRAVGLDVHYKVGPWNDIKEDLINGRLDALPLVSYSQERDERMDFTAPYLRIHGAIFVRNDASGTIRTEADLKNRQILVMRGDTAHEYVERNKLSENLVLTPNYEDAMKMLSAGKGDAVIVQYLVGLQLIKDLGITNVMSVTPIHETSLKPTLEPLAGFEQKFCIAVQEGDDNLQSLLNEGLALVISSGQYDQLYDKWFGPILPEQPISPGRMLRYLLYIIVPFLAFTLIVGVWLLKREVARKTRALEEQIAISDDAKLAVETSEKRLRAVLDNSPLTITEVDLDGRYLLINSAIANIYQLPHSEIIGKKFAELLPPETARVFMGRLKQVKNSRCPIEVEDSLPDGEAERFFRTTLFPLFDNSGAIQSVGAIANDITDRVQADKKLQESLALLNNLAKLVPGVIYQYRLYPDGRSAFPYSSPGMFDIYGVTPEEVQEDASVVFGRLHPEDHDRVAELIFESANKLTTFRCEFRVILPDQGLGWRWSQANPQRTDDGGTLWHGIIIDITDRKQAEEEQANLREQLQQAQKMESIGRLAGGVAHDYNNMLSVILGYTDLALEKTPSSDPLHADLTEVYNAASRSADITRQLLAFARKQTIVPKIVELNVLIESSLKMLMRLIGENIDLDWHPANELWRIKIDPIQVDQILANLCVNARDAISGTGKIIIETGNAHIDEAYSANHEDATPGDYVMLAFSDDGSGMDNKTLHNIFEPFFTTKDIDRGTGLGLATIYGIVKQNKGFINVNSEPGKGTAFEIYLPRYMSDAQDKISTGASKGPSGRGETVLLVEDEPAIRKMAQSMLRRLGYTVLTAETPSDAVITAKENSRNIDLLLSDVVMPEMNGRELSNKIRAICPKAKLLFMSGYTANVIANHGIVEEGTNFIQKPFSKKDLGEKIRFVLDN